MMFSCRSSLSAFLPPPPVAVATFCPARGYAVAASSVANPISTVSKRVVSLSGAMSADGTIDNIMDTAAITSSTPTTSFEAILPDPAVVMGMGFVVLLCIAASYVWGNEVVPVSRTKLAISKSRGGEDGTIIDDHDYFLFCWYPISMCMTDTFFTMQRLENTWMVSENLMKLLCI